MAKRQIDIPDGEPCRHPGCLSHITHPCEVCGRIGGISEPVTDDEIDRLAYALDGDYRGWEESAMDSKRREIIRAWLRELGVK